MTKKKKEHVLTEAEEKRKVYLEQQTKEMEAQGFVRKDIVFNVVALNVGAILLGLVPVIPFYIAFRTAWGGVEWHLSTVEYILFWIVVVLLIVVHEWIHGGFFALFNKNHFRSVAFGVNWRALAPYCTCSEPIRRWQYAVTALAPTVILGLVPMGLALHFGQPTLLYWGLLLTLGGGGDLLCIIRMLTHRQKGKECLFLDHPYEIGMIVFERPKEGK